MFEFHTIDNYDDIDSCFAYLLSLESEYLVIDVETNSSHTKKATLFGIGLCSEDHEAFYIPLRKNDGSPLWFEHQLKNIINNVYNLASRKKVIGHNIIYDVLVIKNNWDIDITEFVYADTILMKHSIDEEPPHNLKDTGVKYLGSWANKAQEKLYDNIKLNGGKTNKDDVEMWKAATEVLAEYCAFDTLITLKLFHLFQSELKKQNLEDLFYKDEIMPLYKECIIPMKDKGFPIDVDHFKKLKEELIVEISKYEEEIQSEISPLVSEFIVDLLNKLVPVKNSGDFPKAMAEVHDIPLPEKHGRITLSKKDLTKFQESNPRHALFYKWILEETELTLDPTEAQKQIFFNRNPDKKYIFNINSPQHLSWLFFNKLGIKPLDYTEKGAPKLDAESLEQFSGQHEFANKIINYKKLEKLLSTYVEGMLDKHVDGVIYTDYQMFGTTSGRFSSKNPNLQNCPRIKDEDSNLSPIVLKYTNLIKKGFIPPKGYKLVNADYSQLEVVCFASASGETLMQQYLKNKFDIYSAIAIDAEQLDEYSANKKDINYLGKHKKEIRQKFKGFALASVYGSGASRVSEMLNISFEEAQQMLDNYFQTYPQLKKYMNDCDYNVIKKGYVKSRFGRIRHLPEAVQLHKAYGHKLLNYKWAKENGLENERRRLKNILNNAKNFPIQGMAAHIVNRAMIAISRELKRNNIDGYIVAQLHDEITLVIKKNYVEEAKKILKNCMENTTLIEVPLTAEPVIADNWAESK